MALTPTSILTALGDRVVVDRDGPSVLLTTQLAMYPGAKPVRLTRDETEWVVKMLTGALSKIRAEDARSERAEPLPALKKRKAG